MDIFNSYLEAQSQQTIAFAGVAIFLCFFFVIAGRYIAKQDPMKKPSKFIIIIDMYYRFISDLQGSIYKGYCKKTILPYVSMLLILVFTCNWSSLFLPIQAPTSDYNVPLALVVISFGFKYVYEYKYLGAKEHLLDYFRPFPVMFPLNVLDVIAKPLSMSMRLFGNLLSGTLILIVVYSAAGALQGMVLPFVPIPTIDGEPSLNIFGAILAPPLHFYLDTFTGTIQAFVFTLLTLIFSSLGINFEEMSKKKAEES